MLHHVTEQRALLEALDEATRAAEAAVMLCERGHRLQQAVGEAGDEVGLQVGETAEVEQAAHHRRRTESVRAAVDRPLDDTFHASSKPPNPPGGRGLPVGTPPAKRCGTGVRAGRDRLGLRGAWWTPATG